MKSSFGIVFFSLFLVCIFKTRAQQDTLKYWIQFTDKNGSIYSVNEPENFLSQRAIDRRIKNSIPITEQDFPVNQSYINSILELPSVALHNQSRWFNALTISCWDTNTITLVEQLPFVIQVQIVKKHKINGQPEDFVELEECLDLKSAPVITNTPRFPYGFSYNQNHLHKIDYLHEMGFHGYGVHIAVIDSGFEFVNGMRCFDHLFSEGRLLSTKDFVEHDGDVFGDHLHGTVVLSTMAAVIPGKFFGTATQASYHLLRSEAVDYEHIVEEDNWIAAAEYADSAGVDVLNTSLGYTTFDEPEQDHSYLDLDGNTTRIAQASNIAATKGILLVASAGNLGNSDWGYISTPADASLTLTVGAVDSIGNYAPFSSFGPNSSGEIKPNVASVGWQGYVVLPWGEGIVKANGTSFSAPMMAGMAATLWSALPHLDNFEIKSLIESVGHQFHAPDFLLGYGIPNFYEAYKKTTGVLYPMLEGIELQSVHPNPVVDQFEIRLRSGQARKIQIVCYDLHGKELHREFVDLEEGVNAIKISEFTYTNSITLVKIMDELGNEIVVQVIGG